MMIHPNETVVRGRVTAIRPESSGWGAEVALEVLRNETPSPETDFIQPQRGSVMNLFAAETDGIQVGDVIRARARVNGGPSGERSVLTSAERVADAG